METAEALAVARGAALFVCFLLIALAYLAWYRVPECKECPHCISRRRRLEADLKERRHNEDHRWYGYCSDKACSRNPARPGKPPAEPPTP